MLKIGKSAEIHTSNLKVYKANGKRKKKCGNSSIILSSYHQMWNKTLVWEPWNFVFPYKSLFYSFQNLITFTITAYGGTLHFNSQYTGPTFINWLFTANTNIATQAWNCTENEYVPTFRCCDHTGNHIWRICFVDDSPAVHLIRRNFQGTLPTYMDWTCVLRSDLYRADPWILLTSTVSINYFRKRSPSSHALSGNYSVLPSMRFVFSQNAVE